MSELASRFLSRSTACISPYVPGEQPKEREYIKLNTNECPYPPSPAVQAAVMAQDTRLLRLYPDPDASALNHALAVYNGLADDQVLPCGGSDEALAFAFMAFFDRGDKVYFPDITYGFYKVYADLFQLQAVEIALKDDFTIDIKDYFALDGNIFIANPNAPTGIVLSPNQIEEILKQNPDRLVVVDEAYIDFSSGNSVIPLIDRYENLLVTQTFSKSRALAGMRIGAAFGQKPLIDGMNRIKYSFNPYNLDRISIDVGIAALEDKAYFYETVEKIIATRQRVYSELIALGYMALKSNANFLFIQHPALTGKELYQKLRNSGILVRHFPKERMSNFVRLTIGTDQEMNRFLDIVKE